ncbi:MAG TPA: hypothetical protein VGN46_15335 [Luteibacter sp.]|jgi:hypothetical protein|uniref:hypothetical protein n=1 Tax=Luteibacter sp. TaxID=1886636 RepID=UPI002F3FBE2D
MNARPYIFGCLCLVGATGTAAAYDIEPTSGLFSMGGAASSSFEGSGGRAQGSAPHDNGTTGGDVMSTRPGSGNHSSGSSSASTSPTVDSDDASRDGPAPVRAPVPSWQSLLPGSML